MSFTGQDNGTTAVIAKLTPPTVTRVSSSLRHHESPVSVTGESKIAEGLDGHYDNGEDSQPTLTSLTQADGVQGASVVAPVPDDGFAGGKPKGLAPMRNLYTAAMSYNGYTITDGALRLIVLLNAARLGFNAIEIAFMFSMYEVAGVFTNLFGGLAGNKYGLRCTLLTSLVLQIACLLALTQTESLTGNLEDASGTTRLEATIYITAWQALAGVAKDLMKLTGKSTPKLVTKQGAEGRLFQLVAWLTGMKNALKGFGHFLGALLVEEIGYEKSLFVLVGLCFIFVPVGVWGMDEDLGISETKKIDWIGLYRKGRKVNLLSAARFFLFGSRDVWFEIGLPLFLKLSLEWREKFVGLFLAGYIVIYGNLQAASTKLYKKSDGTAGHPTARSAFQWAAWCSVVPLITGIDGGTAAVLIVGLMIFAGVFATNSSIHSYLIVSYSNKDKVSIDLGFYYMANAAGRLVGTLLGGFLYHYTFEDFGLSICLVVACPFLVAAAVTVYALVPADERKVASPSISQSVKQSALAGGGAASMSSPNGEATKDLESSIPDTLQYRAELPPAILGLCDTVASDVVAPQPCQGQGQSNDVDSNSSVDTEAPGGEVPSLPAEQVNPRGSWLLSSPSRAAAPRSDAEVAEIMASFFPTE